MNEYRSPYNEGFGYALNGGLRRSKSEPLTTGGVRVWSGLKSLGFAGSEVICGSDTIAVRFVPYRHGIYHEVKDMPPRFLVLNAPLFEFGEPDSCRGWPDLAIGRRGISHRQRGRGACRKYRKNNKPFFTQRYLDNSDISCYAHIIKAE